MPQRPRLNRSIRLADGRHVGFAEAGDPDGVPLFYFHGTPSSRLEVLRISAAATRAGWRVIAPDRPGHGMSDPQRRRDVLDGPAEIEVIADVLGFETFALLGYSGGACHALAAAHLLGHTVSRVALVSGWGPIDQPRAYDGVRFIDRVFDRVVASVPGAARLSFKVSTVIARRAPGLVGGAVSGLTDRGLEEVTVELEAHGLGPTSPFLEAFRRGTRGPVQDYRILLRPWGFDPDRVDVPVHIWHGDADTTVPLRHSEYLRTRLPHARLTTVPGEDHGMFFRMAGEILEELARDG